MRFERSIIAAFAAACAILVVGALGFGAAVRQFQYYLAKQPIEIRAALDTLPTTLGRWKRVGSDNRFSKEIVEELDTSQYVDRMYAIDGDPSKGLMDVHVAYYTGTIDDVPHVPERCSVVHGNQIVRGPEDIRLKIDDSKWTKSTGIENRATGTEYASAEVTDPVTLKTSTVYLPIGDFVMKVTEFQNPRQPRKRMVAGYLFIANSRLTSSAYGVRALAFSRTERFAYYCKVQLSMEADIADEKGTLVNKFVDDASELLSSILPPLMARLPDWVAVERSTDGTEPAASPRPASELPTN
ncbi:MAG: exosortase-associated EpsI family protein [Phycisphaerales bacterium]